jgi:hypothetical protein
MGLGQLEKEGGRRKVVIFLVVSIFALAGRCRAIRLR